MCDRFFGGFVRLLLCSILLQIISRNFHYGFVRDTKLTCLGVESNPGPRNYTIKKTIQASHHPCHVRYGRSAVMPLSFRQLRTSIRGSHLTLITFLTGR